MTPERVQRMHDILRKRQPDLTLITDAVFKPHNLSAIIRSCDAFAVNELNVVWPYDDYQTFRGRAMGSQQYVNVKTHKDVSQAIQGFKQQGYQIVAAHFCDQAVPHYDIDYTKPTAIVMGAEKNGVSAKAMDLVDHSIIVPMEGMVQSLNVSVAAALILSEAMHQRKNKGMLGENQLDSETYQIQFFEWCYPDLAKRCKKLGMAYPKLKENGDFVEPAAFSKEYNRRANR
ncbi:tRNA (guanosine(18)-2'-O)-methyltransferase TrmH [Bermanella marisrubri]|uniref:tRNA (guanosine(18)-2'-O)-methyltransferase n=1 Tax=Bermanella marisrubri TaxID=207949 RepID=Q1N3Z0_9GAMM|nr:tRNA (guanosine(18)-2'-O)-methyltransferase TrmH [Bermanella marisrubri]EAT13075.1 putative tRNA/rRNA methyltransferase [Oceanobacter sp. RED65] [Bermanella marisrubri]QIZ82809.1 tRNA (guanosine(18)-2'-O)-methyltransferase TrmH [Bermanella marisrubri]